MRREKYNSNIKESIKKLGLDKKTEEVLTSNGIVKIEDLWCLNRKKLKSLGLKDLDINTIIVKLQLLGLDLNKKVYSVD